MFIYYLALAMSLLQTLENSGTKKLPESMILDQGKVELGGVVIHLSQALYKLFYHVPWQMARCPTKSSAR